MNFRRRRSANRTGKRLAPPKRRVLRGLLMREGSVGFFILLVVWDFASVKP